MKDIKNAGTDVDGFSTFSCLKALVYFEEFDLTGYESHFSV